MYAWPSVHACSAARDTSPNTQVNTTDRSDASDATSPLRVLGVSSTMIAGGNDTIAGLLGGVLEALSIRRDPRRVLHDNPAVVPDAGRFESLPFSARVAA